MLATCNARVVDLDCTTGATYVRDPDDCQRWYQCVSLGKTKEMPSCGLGMVFSKTARMCVVKGDSRDDCDSTMVIGDRCFQRSSQTCYRGSVTLDLQGGGTGTSGIVPDVTILEGPELQPGVQFHCSKMALVKVKFAYPNAIGFLNLLKIELEFGADRIAHMFNFGDSHSNNGSGYHQQNDAEIDNTGNIGENVKIEGSRKCNSDDLNLHTGAVGPDVTSAKVWLANQYYRMTNNAGLDEELCHDCLFALAGQSDSEGPVNEEIYLAFNRVVNGDQDRRGYGTCTAKISWECPTPSDLPTSMEQSSPTT